MRKRFIKTILFLLTVVIVSVTLRLFCLELFSIPSGSMKDTLLPGDKVLVNKLAYGPKLPATANVIPFALLGFSA